MSYLVVKYNTITQIMDAEAVEPSKPYVKVKDGYFPLTTETNRTGLYTRVLGSSYRLVQRSYTTTSEITSSSTHVDSYISTESGYVTESETESTITGSGYVRYSKPPTYTATITVRATLPPYGSASIVYNTSMHNAYSSASIRTASLSRANTNKVHSVFIYSPTMRDSNHPVGAMTFKETISVPETSYTSESRSSETFDTYTIETLRSIIVSNTEMYFTYTSRTTASIVNNVRFTRVLQYGQTMTNALTYTQYTLRSDMYNEFTITDIYSSTVTLTIR